MLKFNLDAYENKSEQKEKNWKRVEETIFFFFGQDIGFKGFKDFHSWVTWYFHRL